MSRDTSTLKDICGGRYSFMPAPISEDPDLSAGALKLYSAMCGKADKAGFCKFHLKGFARLIGRSVRTVQNWKRELESEGWMEELHEGDKAVGQFRVIRNPKESKIVRIINAPKIADRAKRKTTHANLVSHSRCESCFAHYKNIQDLPVSPHEQNAHPSETDGGLGTARQGNREGAGPVVPTAPSRCVTTLNNRSQNNEPDLAGWARWLVSSRRMSDEEAWLWLMAEIDRIAEERCVSKEEAGRILDQRLKIQRRAEK